MCAVTDVWFVCSNLSGFVYTLLHFFTEDLSHTKRGKNNSLHYEFRVYSNKCDTALTFSQHNKRARATRRQLSPVCLTDDLHYACTVWRNVRMKAGGGGSDLFFPVLLVCREHLVVTFQAGFTVTMKTEVRVNTPHPEQELHRGCCCCSVQLVAV